MQSKETRLYQAVALRHHDIVQTMLEEGMRCNFYRRGSGMMPIHHAAHNGDHEMLKLLMQHGSVIDSENTRGLTPIECLPRSQYPEEEVVSENYWDCIKVFIDHNKSGLKYDWALLNAVKAERMDMIEALLKAGADPNHLHLSKDGKVKCTVLYLAALDGDINPLKLFLKYGADFSVLSSRKGEDDQNHYDSVMTVLVKNQHWNAVRWLAKNCKDESNKCLYNAALLQAIKYGVVDIVETLLNAGASPNARYANRKTALDLAIESGNERLIKLLSRKKETKKSGFYFFKREPAESVDGHTFHADDKIKLCNLVFADSESPFSALPHELLESILEYGFDDLSFVRYPNEQRHSIITRAYDERYLNSAKTLCQKYGEKFKIQHPLVKQMNDILNSDVSGQEKICSIKAAIDVFMHSLEEQPSVKTKSSLTRLSNMANQAYETVIGKNEQCKWLESNIMRFKLSPLKEGQEKKNEEIIAEFVITNCDDSVSFFRSSSNNNQQENTSLGGPEDKEPEKGNGVSSAL